GRVATESTGAMSKTKAKKPGKNQAQGRRHSIPAALRIPGRPSFDWVMENGAAYNFRELGKLLDACDPGLFRRADSYGLYKTVPGKNTPATVATGKAL